MSLGRVVCVALPSPACCPHLAALTSLLLPSLHRPHLAALTLQAACIEHLDHPGCLLPSPRLPSLLLPSLHRPHLAALTSLQHLQNAALAALTSLRSPHCPHLTALTSHPGGRGRMSTKMYVRETFKEWNAGRPSTAGRRFEVPSPGRPHLTALISRPHPDVSRSSGIMHRRTIRKIHHAETCPPHM